MLSTLVIPISRSHHDLVPVWSTVHSMKYCTQYEVQATYHTACNIISIPMYWPHHCDTKVVDRYLSLGQWESKSLHHTPVLIVWVVNSLWLHWKCPLLRIHIRIHKTNLLMNAISLSHTIVSLCFHIIMYTVYTRKPSMCPYVTLWGVYYSILDLLKEYNVVGWLAKAPGNLHYYYTSSNPRLAHSHCCLLSNITIDYQGSRSSC